MRHIRAYVAKIAEKFDPDKIILFGSRAYGTPHEESDVDLLVVMPCRNELDQSVKIGCAFEPPFPLDLIVRKPKVLEYRLRDGDWFLREIVSRGKVMYAREDSRVGGQSRGRPGRRPTARPRQKATS